MDLALADGDAAMIFHRYFKDRVLSDEDLMVLDILLSDLPGAVALLEGPARHYFEDAVQLLRTIHQELNAH